MNECFVEESKKIKEKRNKNKGVAKKGAVHATTSTIISNQTYEMGILNKYDWGGAGDDKEGYYRRNEGEMHLLWH